MKIKKQFHDESKLSSSDPENSNDYRITDTEVELIEPINETSFYILNTINNYPNTDTKFIILISPHKNNKEAGTVTLSFNGNSYLAEVFNGKAIITAKTPSKVGTYKATLSYSGYTYLPSKEYYHTSTGYFYSNSKVTEIYNPSSSIFTLTVKSSTNNVDSATTIKAPKVTAFYKAKKYFKVTIKKGNKAVKDLKLKVKVYTGSKYKTYTIKTNKNGVAKLSTKKFKIGSHKVKITSKNSKYKISKSSKIVIKKKTTKKKSSYTYFKSPSGYKWKIKTTTWKKMKKQSIKNFKSLEIVSGGVPRYSDMSINVNVTKNGHTYKGFAYARTGSSTVCEVRGVKTGLRLTDKYEYWV